MAARVISIGRPDWYTQKREPDQMIVVPKRAKISSKYYSVKQVADRFGVGIHLIYDLVRTQKIHGETLGRTIRISEEALLTYLELSRLKKT